MSCGLRTAARQSTRSAASKTTPAGNHLEQAQSPVSRIQSALGNQAMQKFLQDGVLQAKLTVNPPGDQFERDADRVADAVRRMSGAPAGTLQRACSCGGSCDECRPKKMDVRRKPAGSLVRSAKGGLRKAEDVLTSAADASAIRAGIGDEGLRNRSYGI